MAIILTCRASFTGMLKSVRVVLADSNLPLYLHAVEKKVHLAQLRILAPTKRVGNVHESVVSSSKSLFLGFL